MDILDNTPAAMASRTPLGTLTASRQNSEGGDGVDFSKLTPSQFGISTDSFLTFPKDKNKSRVSQLKARRRSTVGLRGSPETSSLISFRAKQAMKTPPRSPQVCGRQRLLLSVILLLADAISQLLVQGCFSHKLESQLISRICPPPDTPTATPPLSKRRRRVPRGLCEEEIQEEPLCDLPGTPNQEPGVSASVPFIFHCSSDQIPALSHVTEVSSASRKKRVRFGAPLSPEFFDKTLPPSTPLQRGATPLCPPSSTGHKRSLLKTPQQCEPPLPQPNFSSPESHDGSLVLTGPGCGSEGLCCEDVFVGPQKVSLSAGESIVCINDSAVTGHLFETVLTLSSPAGCDAPESRRSSRSAASAAKGKMKTAAANRRFGSKEVDRSLYGKRDYASRNPMLSPIFEAATAILNGTPPRLTQGQLNEEPLPALQELTVTNGITCTPVWDTPASESEVGVAPSGVSHTGNVGSVAPRAKRNRGRPLTRRRSWNVSKSEMEKVSGGMMGKRQHVEESPLESTTGGQMSDPAKSQGVPSTEEEEEEDHQSILGAKTEEKNKESLDKPSVAVGPSKISEISGEGWRDGGENAEPVLESWQQVDFSIEDILKPTVKGRGSVRRSLRNRLSVDAQASGLAWVERTPPEQSTASRRKTRGRLSAVLEAPPLPLAPREEELNQAD
uniref:PP1-binding domain-containing protein n=1 Tax=Electrophorus electricus TaxID=8005 RepID=A0A4W4EXJ9_ELEEL